jgi:hypothetical protein
VYGPEITTCHYKGLLQELVILCYGCPVTRVPACNAKVFSCLKPLLHLVGEITFCVFPRTTEQDSQPTTSLISKQAVPYRTHGSIYCPEVPTPKTQSLENSSMTNHNTWQITTVSIIPTHVQTTASNLTTVTSHHDGWKTNTLNTQHKPKLNIIKMEHLYKDSRLHGWAIQPIHKNQVLKYKGIGNQLMHATSVF